MIGTNGNATVNGAAGTPFLSATKLTYKGGIPPPRVITGKCKNIVYMDTYLSGSLNVKFDSGPVQLDGTTMLDFATTTRIVKA